MTRFVLADQPHEIRLGLLKALQSWQRTAGGLERSGRLPTLGDTWELYKVGKHGLCSYMGTRRGKRVLEVFWELLEARFGTGLFPFGQDGDYSARAVAGTQHLCPERRAFVSGLIEELKAEELYNLTRWERREALPALKEWQAQATSNLPSFATRHYGLCSSVGYSIVGDIAIFDGLDPDYPFGRVDYIHRRERNTQHLCPKRQHWVAQWIARLEPTV